MTHYLAGSQDNHENISVRKFPEMMIILRARGIFVKILVFVHFQKWWIALGARGILKILVFVNALCEALHGPCSFHLSCNNCSI